ncbi:hypothetical protein M885DRAFT_507123 [Pelagophyceae sp. CCMP2097]|nr:hypothetical protein M885DRAFT_507123 [Pelagophyceae sp. CCMP2097]
MRCDREDADGVLATDGCAATCGTCTNDEGTDDACVDSATWFKGGQPKKPCGWVAEDVMRCNREDADGVLATDGCAATCGTCTTDVPCADSATWFKGGQPKKPCDWVAQHPGDRCAKKDLLEVLASDACSKACSTCPFS